MKRMIRAFALHASLSLLFVILAAYCVKPQIREFSGCKIGVDLEGVVDIAEAGPALLFVAVHNRRFVDMANEHRNDGRIVTVNRRSLEMKVPPILGRDEYPFKPLGIDAVMDHNDPLVFVVNEGFRNQRSIEVYRFQRNSLVFQKRIRNVRLQRISDVVLLSADDYVLAGESGSLLDWQSGDVIYHTNKKLQYLPFTVGHAGRLARLGNRSVVIPNGHDVLEFDADRLTLAKVNVPVAASAPIAAGYSGSALVLLHDLQTPLVSFGPTLYKAPVEKPSSFLVLGTEKKFLIGARDAGLTICELPAP